MVKSFEELNKHNYSGHTVLMGNIKREWQDVDHLLAYFGKQLYSARKHYYTFVTEGVDQGRRDELMGGGVIRSLGGWSAIDRNNLKGANIKSDERIVGDGDFVDSILSRGDEKFERYYKVKRSGYDLDKAALRVASLCAVEVDDIFSRSSQKSKVKGRSLFCYWVSRESGVSHTE